MKEKKRPTKAQQAFISPERQANEYLEECELAHRLRETVTIELTTKDLMMIMVATITPFVRQLNQLTKDMEELKEVTLHFADEVRKMKKRKH